MNKICGGFLLYVYTHVTSRCFVRRKLVDQSNTQHEVMIIPFPIGVYNLKRHWVGLKDRLYI
ncbi:MAG: hypothetical protein ACI892_000780, partial [Marinobacter maritimus]